MALYGAQNRYGGLSDSGGHRSAGSIKLNNISNENDIVIKEYEVETAAKKVTNPFEHFKGLCKVPSWIVFLAGNGVLLVCVVSLGVVLGMSLTKVSVV